MRVLTTISDCRAERAKHHQLAMVPTMGALHAGHAALIELAHQYATSVAVSIFVNPTQFGPREDFNRYPRPIDDDLELCRRGGVDFVFNPPVEEIYASAIPDVIVDLPSLSTLLEGKHRPGHFKGVCQIVAKLFNIIRPDFACFGQKDYQQLRIISAMVGALNWPIQIVPCPTLRDPDGLAISSRNRYLSPAERQRALSINKGLRLAEAQINAGINQTNRLTTTIQNLLLEQHLAIDYIASVDPITLKMVEVVTGPTLFAVAARVGTTRLIDNLLVKPPWDLVIPNAPRGVS